MCKWWRPGRECWDRSTQTRWPAWKIWHGRDYKSDTASDGDPKDRVRARASRHIDQHEPTGMDVQTTKEVQEGVELVRASGGEPEESAGARASRHAESHAHSGIDVQQSRAVKECRRSVCASDRDSEESVGAEASSMVKLAWTYKNQNRYNEAEDFCVQMVETQKRVGTGASRIIDP